MKIYYSVNMQGVVEADDDDWEELKHDYENNIKDFAQATVEDELGIFDNVVITNIKRD